MALVAKQVECPQIRVLMKEEAGMRFPFIWEDLSQAFDYGPVLPDESFWRQRVVKGDTLLLEVVDSDCPIAYVMLNLAALRGGDALEVVAIRGHSMQMWLADLVNMCEYIAEGYGCRQGIILRGRRGWARVLKQFGFRQEPIITMRKEAD